MAQLESSVRTNDGDVTDTLAPEGTVLSNDEMHLHMNTAHHFVENEVSGHSDPSSSQLEDLERLLSAHFIRISDRDVDSQSVMDDERDYQGETGMNFEATLFGQQAMSIDPTGRLKQMNSSESTEYLLNVGY